MDADLIATAQEFLATGKKVIEDGRQNPPVVAFLWPVPAARVAADGLKWAVEVATLDFRDDRCKEASYRSVHRYVADRRVAALIFLSEAWEIKVPRDAPPDPRPPAARPDRRETLTVALFTPAEMRHFAVYVEREEGVTFKEYEELLGAECRVDPWQETRRQLM